MISLLLLQSFLPASSKEKESNELIAHGHSLWSANQLPAQAAVKPATKFARK